MRPREDPLAVAIAAAVCLMWLVAGFAALFTDNDARVFEITTGVFFVVVGYKFGVSISRRVAPNGEGVNGER